MASAERATRSGGDVWKIRFRQDGKNRAEVLGPVERYPTKEDALAAWGRGEAKKNRRQQVSTVGEMIDWVLEHDPPQRVSTYTTYKSVMNRIRQEWGNHSIASLSEALPDVRPWLMQMKTKGGSPCAPQYRGLVRTLFGGIVEKAIEQGFVGYEVNPLSRIRMKNTGHRKRDLVVLTTEQCRTLMSDKRLPTQVKAMVYLMLCLGLRISEVLGLRWEDVDLRAGTIHVRRSWVRGVALDTKSESSNQVLPLHPMVREVLERWRMVEPSVNGWLFGSASTGKPVDKSSISRKYLASAGRRIGAPSLGFHSLRHTYRSLQRSADLPMEMQKQLMRHSNIATTIDRYGGKSDVEQLRLANNQVVELLRLGDANG